MCVGGGEAGLAIETDRGPAHTHIDTTSCTFFFYFATLFPAFSAHPQCNFIYLKEHVLSFDSSSWNICDLFLLFHTDVDRKCEMWADCLVG